MAIFEIEGGNKLSGEVRVSGAKNEALKLIAFSVCLQGETTIANVPEISDIKSQLEIFRLLGGEYSFENNTLVIDSSDIKSAQVDRDMGCKLRASLVFMGPLLARFSHAEIPYPGGCVIGARPIDTHTDAFAQLGAKIESSENFVNLTIDKVSNNIVNLKEQSVSATENILMFAAMTEEEITVNNCAIEPEIIDLISKINSSGAQVTKIGDRSFRVNGSKNLKLSSCSVVPDRIEAGSYLVALLATGGAGSIVDFPYDDLECFMDVLKRAGARFERSENNLNVFASDSFLPFEISTSPYPGFPTDLQSPMALIATRATGTSKINELMFENRLLYIDELKKMGVNAKIIDKNHAEIYGPCDLIATEIESLDLRSGMTLLIAALMADGKSKIMKAEMIDRGYERIEEKLKNLGARITRYD